MCSKMLLTLRSLKRPPSLVVACFLSYTAGNSSISWLSTSGHPPICRRPPPQWRTDTRPQFFEEPPDAQPISCQEGENVPDVGDDSAAAISSLIRCTPISDLKSAILRSGLIASLNLSFVLNLLIRSHSFDLAWSLLLSQPSSPLSAFASLFRGYSRARMPSASIRTFLYLRSHPHLLSPSSDDHQNPLELLLDALCKEGHQLAASHFFVHFKSENRNWVASVSCYNILLHGCFRLHKLNKAERLWSEMRCCVQLNAASYCTAIEGLCRLRRPDQAMELLEEMRASRMDTNLLTCNLIVVTLSEAARFKEALGFVERFPLFGISPDISTFNSLIKGFCKNADLRGASNVLKKMIEKGILPTSTTYNYFFTFFAKFGKIEEAMNLYSKLVQSGYALDRLTFQLLIKMLCEEEKLDLTVQMIKEMNGNGFQLDLAMSTMLVHLLCHLRRYDEACNEIEEMIRKGIVPQYVTYQKLLKEFKRLGLVEMEDKLSALMNSVSHSTKLSSTYRDKVGSEEAKKKSILPKKTWRRRKILGRE